MEKTSKEGLYWLLRKEKNPAKMRWYGPTMDGLYGPVQYGVYGPPSQPSLLKKFILYGLLFSTFFY
jgi:hypothetical protein